MKPLILGVDPGSRTTGYGLVAAADDGWRHVASGYINLATQEPQSRRLAAIFAQLTELIAVHQPQALALEEIFVAHNVQSTLKLGEVRGVVLLAAGQAGLPVFHYPPAVVKKAVVGYGQATKTQVLMMVEQLLGLKISNHNTADALALSLCHLFHYRWHLQWPEARPR